MRKSNLRISYPTRFICNTILFFWLLSTINVQSQPNDIEKWILWSTKSQKWRNLTFNNFVHTTFSLWGDLHCFYISFLSTKEKIFAWKSTITATKGKFWLPTSRQMLFWWWNEYVARLPTSLGHTETYW